jgi:hypothetical protein
MKEKKGGEEKLRKSRENKDRAYCTDMSPLILPW